jgi:hypothetical protein
MPTFRFLLLAVALVPAQSSRWKDIGTTSTGNPVQIDPKSVKTAKDGIITATFRVPYAKPFDHPKGKVTVTRAVAMFDCGKRTVAVKASTMYLDEKAGRIAEKSAPKIPGFGPTFSSTFSGVAMDYLCPKK